MICCSVKFLPPTTTFWAAAAEAPSASAAPARNVTKALRSMVPSLCLCVIVADLRPAARTNIGAVPTAKSMSTASIAVGIAPASSMPGSLTSMPVKISSPSPPPPIRKASGAVPTLIASAVRMPARITKAAFGTSTFRRISKRVMPMPRAASIRCGGTLSMPATVLSTIGSSVRTNSPKMTGGRPSPSTVMAMARIASVGTVVPRLTTWVMALA